MPYLESDPARGGSRSQYKTDANAFTAPVNGAVLRPASFSSVAVLSSGGAAAERIASHAVAAVAAPSTAMRMGVVGPGVGRAVGKGLAAAALATVGSGGDVGVPHEPSTNRIEDHR